MKSNKIGFIGLGKMGTHMAQRISNEFGPIHVYDADARPLSEFREAGCFTHSSPISLAQDCDCILLSLPNGGVVEEVLGGDEGALKKIVAGTIIADLSTIGPAAAKRFSLMVSDHGGSYLDVPVGGGQAEAKSGTLTLLCGGDEHKLNQIRPVLDCLGSNLHYFGESGNGQAAKLALNLSYGIMTCGAAETCGMLNAYGLDKKHFLDVVGELPVARWFAKPIVDDIDDSFPAGFQVDLMSKDLRLALEALVETDTNHEATRCALSLFESASDAGFGKEHTSAVARLYR